MKHKIQPFILAAAIFGDRSSAAPQKVSKGTLVSRRKTALGNVLVDARGHTLYLFEKDKAHKLVPRHPPDRPLAKTGN